MPSPADFQFVLTPAPAQTIDGTDYPGSPANTPPIGPITISFGGAAGIGTKQTRDGVDYYFKELALDLADVAWPNAGYFSYIVTETAGTNTYTPVAPVKSEVMTYSLAQYRLDVVIWNNPDTDELEVYNVGAWRLVTDPEIPGVGKLDPTPGGERWVYDETEEHRWITNPGDSGTDMRFSGMAFVNTFVRTIGDPTIPDPDSAALNISKAVTGIGADQTLAFSFSVTLTRGPLDKETGTIPAQIWDTSVTPNVMVGSAISITPGTPTTFTLTHGQRLALGDAPVGTTYVVSETATPLYKPSYIIITGGGAGVANPAPGPDFGGALATGIQYIRELPNSAAFSNERQSIPITGLTVNNIPFVILILLAAGGLVIFIVFKAKRRNHN